MKSFRVSIACVLALLCAAAGPGSVPTTSPATRPRFEVGHIDHPPIGESSGIVPSRKYPDVFWTHNDSGNPPVLYAITREGKLINEFPVAATNRDWEDIAIDDAGHLYIGEIGNNNGRFNELSVYRVDEPDPHVRPDRGGPGLTVNQTWRLRFPDKPFDCESLFVWKDSGYVVSKLLTLRDAALYRFALAPQRGPVVLEKVCDLPIRSPATAADLSADGKQLAVMTVTGPYLFEVNGDPAAAGRVKPAHVRFFHPSMEAVCFVPEGLLATTESRQVFLFRYGDFKAGVAPLRPEPVHVEISPGGDAITVDGELSDWDLKAASLPVRHANDLRPQERQPSLWVRWEPAGLYLAGVVPQEKVTPLLDVWYAGDAVEVFIGREYRDRPDEYAAGDDRCYFGFAKAADGTLGPFGMHWPRDEGNPPAGARAAGRIDPAGTYQFEAFLSAGALSSPGEKDHRLAAGDTIRLNVSILMRTPPQNWFLSESNEAGTWMSPTTWAVATLR